MGEDKRGAGDVADLARAGGDVLEGAPALVEQGEPAFAQAAQRALDGVAGTGIDIQLLPAGGLSDRDEDADARRSRGRPGWAGPLRRGRERAGRGCGRR